VFDVVGDLPEGGPRPRMDGLPLRGDRGDVGDVARVEPADLPRLRAQADLSIAALPDLLSTCRRIAPTPAGGGGAGLERALGLSANLPVGCRRLPVGSRH
jgi:hypothetical protein